MKAYVKSYLEKKGYRVNMRALDIIRAADDWYRSRVTDAHKMVSVNGESYELARMGFAKRAASDDANLCEVIEINAGASDDLVRDALNENRFDTQYRAQLELMSAEGTVACYVRIAGADVMSDGSMSGGDIRLSYIEAGHYLPLTIENGDVLEAAFWGANHVGTEERVTLVICTRDEHGVYWYETVLFDDDGRITSVTRVELGEVKPFAVMRTAEVNHIDNMSGYGYPKVYGAIPIFKGLDAAFTALLADVDDAKAITFINERICGFDDAGRPIPPNRAQKKRFVFLGESLPSADSVIQRDTPDIRIDAFKQTIELLFSAMSSKFGFGTKKYNLENAQIQTATQYIGERQDMMQELNKQRYCAIEYINGIVRAIRWFSNRFHGTNCNIDEEIHIDFDDSYIENRATRLETYRQDALVGLGGEYTRQLYLKEKYNLDDAEAALWAGAIAQEPEEDDA